MQGQFDDANGVLVLLQDTFGVSKPTQVPRAVRIDDWNAEDGSKQLELDPHQTSDGFELLDEWCPDSEQGWNEAQAYPVDDEYWEAAEKGEYKHILEARGSIPQPMTDL
ncbi:hypothetical protein FRB96_009620 [Tulasnella sp. 330]|nr:hypothetical protein FRB96_009620 [Tulasnella sp. 330]KAG8873757.1 hypothetical protein FRB97_006461 [Tulasnella sp. 331]